MAKRVRIMAEQAVPQTMEDAMLRLRRFAELEAALAEIKLEADRAKAAIDAERDLAATPVIAAQKVLVAELKPFWLARAQEITGGKRKSVVMGGCEIGTRTGNPTLTYAKAREEELISELDALGFGGWALRMKLELDKPALIKALQMEPGLSESVLQDDKAVLEDMGFAVRQTETFFVQRAESEPAESATLRQEVA